MEKNNEFSGKSVDEAIEKGLAQWGVSREKVDVEIIREASRGVFGLGGEDALVRLSTHSTPPASAAELPEAASPAGDGAAVAKETLETLLRGIGLNARVEARPDTEQDEETLILNIVGHDLGILIGRRGETLHDLEFLTRLLVQRRTNQTPRITVDVENYRTRRERILRELAKRMGERVEASKQPITLEAMPPNERRIVHIALRDHPNVTTQSIGEGDHRRVMILPKT
jgi:spoIIIJ-associated protein